MLLSLHVNSDGGAIFQRSLNLKPSYFEQFQELKFRDGITLIPVLLHPKSRGQIRLRSKNPFDKPVIIPNYFQKSEDMQTLIEAIKVSFSLVYETKAFGKFGAKFFNKVNPACAYYEAFSQKYWECISRYVCIILFFFGKKIITYPFSFGRDIIIIDTLFWIMHPTI